ncbi:CDP-alcohol phosphatidyltransferase family protein [Sphingoaurantiacus capsulatus]|uniref:CDP-alcohol phosphatidyltransferase family protein n=1 Tax=Sphingoaurantiacus capsulatus TaxID=1771310 RepID=A0ABV7X935_9SPHN
MTRPPIFPVGSNDTRAWGLTAAERLARIAAKQDFELLGAPPAVGAVLLVDLGHVFDPAWLGHIAGQRGAVITRERRPVLAHVTTDAATAAAAMAKGEVPAGLTVVAVESGIELNNHELRKREAPFMLPLTPATVSAVERASYYGAYKGVTDILTKYLWPELAFHLSRLAAKLGMSPNLVTAIGTAFCIAAFFAFWLGNYWLGIGLGFVFMVLDTVDGKLARCTVTSSKIGDIADHGVDLVHPPFWWWAWLVGLDNYGTPLPTTEMTIILAIIVGGYIAGRLVEGAFLKAWGMHIHVWRPVDSWFRLITARRNPNMVLLFASMLVGRPDIGIIAVAIWTVVSLVFHLVRLAQAGAARAAGRPVASWLG